MQCRAKLKLHEPRGEAKAKAGKIAAFAKKLNASSCMTFVLATHCSLKFLLDKIHKPGPGLNRWQNG